MPLLRVAFIYKNKNSALFYLAIFFSIVHVLANLNVVMFVVQVAVLLQLQVQLATKLEETLAGLTSLQSRILDEELIRWKREQQLAGNGAKFNSNLDRIQEW